MKNKRFSYILQLLGSEIRHRRISLGLSQEAFADLCKLDRTYIGGVERGERNVSTMNLVKISEALEISLSELFTCLDGDKSV